jgi:hypothetical protein
VSPLSPPRKLRNQDVRPREYLTEEEVESLIDAAAELAQNERTCHERHTSDVAI